MIICDQSNNYKYTQVLIQIFCGYMKLITKNQGEKTN